MRKLRLLTFLLFLAPAYAFGATYYMSPSGSDGANGTSQLTPWKTFAHSFEQMSGGDTLMLLNGTYSIAAGTGCINHSGTGSAQPKSGISKTLPTTVQAINAGLVTIDGTGGYEDCAVFIGRSTSKLSHIKISGIKTIGCVWFYNADYCYLAETGVNGPMRIGSNDHTMSCDYNLIEDCWVWCQNERVCVISYEGTHNILRRIVVRGDGENSSPAVGITVYNSQYTLVQNCIVIDRIVGSEYAYADFASAQHATGSNNYPLVGNRWMGCISVNSQDNGYQFEGDSVLSPSHTIINCVAVSENTVIAGLNINHSLDAEVNSLSIIGNYTYATLNGGSAVGTSLSRAIITGTATYDGVNGFGDVSYMDVYGVWGRGAYRYSECISNCSTDDPGVDYVTVSPITGMGATVTHRYGATGAFYGDTGYGDLSPEALWPWPNEDRIKSDMAEISMRGFCSDTLNPRTSTGYVTLTSYIWEYLGNEIPEDIYGAPEYAEPTITVQDATTATSSATISGEYTIDGALTAVCTWSHSSGTVTGFATMLLGVVSGTVTGLPIGDTTVSFSLLDSKDQEATDTAIFTRVELVKKAEFHGYGSIKKATIHGGQL